MAENGPIADCPCLAVDAAKPAFCLCPPKPHLAPRSSNTDLRTFPRRAIAIRIARHDVFQCTYSPYLGVLLRIIRIDGLANGP